MPNYEPGFYWAKTKDYQWWNLIIWITGTAPFLRVAVWDYHGSFAQTDVDVERIEIGPRIERPDAQDQ